jgi:hypothetical protein
VSPRHNYTNFFWYTSLIVSTAGDVDISSRKANIYLTAVIAVLGYSPFGGSMLREKGKA